MKKKLVVPPNSMVAVKCCLDGELAGEVCISPEGDHKGLLIPHMFTKVGVGGHVCISVRNVPGKTLSFRK